MIRGSIPTLALLLGCLLPGLAPHPVQAQGQRAGDPGSRFSVIPVVGINFLAERYEGEGFVAPLDPGADVEVDLGPNDGLLLGLEIEFKAWPTLSVVAGGSWSSLSWVRRTRVEGRDATRQIAGSQELVRLAAGIQWRVVPRAPGYFSAGGVINRFDAGDPVFVQSASDPTEAGGWVGLGLDLGGERKHIRIDWRLHLLSGDDTVLLGTGGGTFNPRGFLVENTLRAGFVFPL